MRQTTTRTRPVTRPSTRRSGSLPAVPLAQRHTRLLNRAKRDPRSALRDPRCRKEPFLSEFLKLCHGLALERPRAALDYARVAVELAEKGGDDCAVHRSLGVLVHALIAGRQRDPAAAVLDQYRDSALDCCRACAGDWHLRRGDLLVESFDPGGAGVELDSSARALGPDAAGIPLGQLCFVRGIQHYFEHHPGRALADAGTALREIDLSAPEGYQMDLLALVACYLQLACHRHHDEQALELLLEHRQRLVDAAGLKAVRTRLVWVEGQVYGRLGDFCRAEARLAKAKRDLFAASAPHRHVLAAGLDYCQLLARRPTDPSRRTIVQTLQFCHARLRLEPALHKGLGKAVTTASQAKRYLAGDLFELRASFIVPVPGILVKLARKVKARARR